MSSSLSFSKVIAGRMEKVSVALISSSIGKTPQDIHYSFVFDEAYKLGERGLAVHVVRSFKEKTSFSNGIHFHGLESASRIKYTPFLFKHLTAIPNIAYLMPPWALLYLAKYGSAVTNVINSQNIGLIHAHFAYPEGFVGLLAKRVTKKPLVVTVHGYDILVEPSVGYGARLSRRIDSIVRKVLNDADAVIAASKATFNEARKLVKDRSKVHLIPNGVDIQRFNPTLDGFKTRKTMGIEGHTVVFTLRAHEPKYGLEYLIRAVPMVAKEKNDVVFVIGGCGSLKHYHEQLAIKLGVQDKIIFAGKIPQSESPFYYAMSDIVVIPSIQEAFGLGVTEAMACGKPTIGTNVGGIPDQIIDGYNGFVVEPRNAKEMAEKILWLIDNRDEAKRMGINGRKTVEEKYNLDERINQILTLYKRV